MECPKSYIAVCEKNGWQRDGNKATMILPGGRKQVVYLEQFVFEGDDMARIYTHVGPVACLSEIQLNAVLGLNFSLAYGALAIYSENLVMTDTFLLDQIDQDQLTYSMRFLGETGDRYEQLIYATDKH